MNISIELEQNKNWIKEYQEECKEKGIQINYRFRVCSCELGVDKVFNSLKKAKEYLNRAIELNGCFKYEIARYSNKHGIYEVLKTNIKGGNLSCVL